MDVVCIAVKRVEIRVQEGGHNIPGNVVRRRYDNGLKNFFGIFKDLVDSWTFIDNSGDPYEIIAEGSRGKERIENENIWSELNAKYNGKKSRK